MSSNSLLIVWPMTLWNLKCSKSNVIKNQCFQDSGTRRLKGKGERKQMQGAGPRTYAAISKLWRLGRVSAALPALILWSLDGPLSCEFCWKDDQNQSLGREGQMLGVLDKRHWLGILIFYLEAEVRQARLGHYTLFSIKRWMSTLWSLLRYLALFILCSTSILVVSLLEYTRIIISHDDDATC